MDHSLAGRKNAHPSLCVEPLADARLGAPQRPLSCPAPSGRSSFDVAMGNGVAPLMPSSHRQQLPSIGLPSPNCLASRSSECSNDWSGHVRPTFPPHAIANDWSANCYRFAAFSHTGSAAPRHRTRNSVRRCMALVPLVRKSMISSSSFSNWTQMLGGARSSCHRSRSGSS